MALLAQADLAPLLVSLGAGATVVIAFAALAALRSPLRLRTASRLAAIGSTDRLYAPPTDALRGHKTSNIPVLASLLRGRSWVDATRDTLARADIPLLVGEYLVLRVLAVAIGIVLGLLSAQRLDAEGLTRAVLVLVGFIVGWLLPPLIVQKRFKWRSEKVETQLVELCDVMSSMLRSGYGYVQSLSATAAEVGPPLSTELQRLLDTVRLGGDVDQALDDLNRRLGSRDFDIVASAISIQRRSGGNLSEILAGAAETIRQRQSFFREVKALTAKERFTAVFVAAFPLGLIALLMWMAPDPYARLVTDVLGRVILGVAIVMDTIGFLVIRKLSQLEV